MEHEIQLSQNAAEDEGLSQSIDSFLASMERELHEEVERVIQEEKLLGEGRTAKVFDLEKTVDSPCRLCAKIWRDKPKKELSYNEYKEIQFLTPQQEFELQDELYRAGCKVPRPIAYGKIGERDVMVMERIVGYDLEKIMSMKAKISRPVWDELMKALIEIKNEHVVHRDIKPGNIMLETDDELIEGAQLEGDIKIIDFGLSKHILGSTPAPDDFREQIGNGVIHYPNDIQRVEELNPRKPSSPFLR